MDWLLVKRGLYYRPNDCGYTGIRDHAGRYSEEEARARLSPGIMMIRLDNAPEFSEACFEDLARHHLATQRDEALNESRRLRARAERLRLELEKIGWMDEFLDADGARAMMQIARDAVNADEDSIADEQDVNK